MGFDRLRQMLFALICALACAQSGLAQTDPLAWDGGDETPAAPASVEPETIPAGTLVPPPAAIERLPSVVSLDGPVPYYSRIMVGDDIPDLSPAFELAPSEVKLGLIASAEVDYLKPFIHNGLNSGNLTVGNLPTAVQAPTAQPSWTAMPRIDLGYRFEQGLGELHGIFQFLNANGTRNVAAFDRAGAGTVTTQLNVDVIDLDYAFTEFNPGRVPRLNPLLLIPGRLGLNLHPEDDPNPMFRLKWAYGVRGANVFYESRAAGQQILAERAMNNFSGAGFHTSVDISKPFPWAPAFGVFGRFEAAGLYGQTTQSFSRTELLPGGPTAAGAGQLRVNTGVPVIDVYAGLSYVPRWRSSLVRLTAGYRLQQWWYLGQVNSETALTMQGVFLRGEIGY
jgi:hypothetical protein